MVCHLSEGRLSYLVHIPHQLPSERDMSYGVSGSNAIVKSCTWTALEATVMVIVLYIAALGTSFDVENTFGCGINLSHIYQITIQLLDLLCCIFCFASYALITSLSVEVLFLMFFWLLSLMIDAENSDFAKLGITGKKGTLQLGVQVHSTRLALYEDLPNATNYSGLLTIYSVICVLLFSLQPGSPPSRTYEAPTPGSGWANTPGGSYSDAGTPRDSGSAYGWFICIYF